MILIVITAIWLLVSYFLCKGRKPLKPVASNTKPLKYPTSALPLSSVLFSPQDELSEKSFLATKKDDLDASSRQWKTRVEKSDAEKFSVAGKMNERIRDATPTINIKDADENEKRTPKAKRFKIQGK